MSETEIHHPRFHKLIDYLARVPSVTTNSTPSRGFGSGLDDGIWWIKFDLDLRHPLAWNAVQELGHVLNYLSIQERLPTTMKPGTVATWLEGRLPRPVDDYSQWPTDEL